MPFEVGHRKVGGRKKTCSKNKQMSQIAAQRAKRISPLLNKVRKGRLDLA
jgi:hypothetical protein